MQKWFWLGLLSAIITTLSTILLSSYISTPRHHSPPTTTAPITATQPPETSFNLPTIASINRVRTSPTILPPKVSEKQLLTHIKALNFERYTDNNRSRARDYIQQNLKSSGWPPTLQPFEGGINIIAQRPGTDPQAGTILLAAHYDTVESSPGADDNASGIATVLEVARLLGQLSTHNTLQIVFFDQEEQGLLGSFAFTNNPTNLTNLRAVIVLDMVGFACHTAGCQTYPKELPITPPSNQGDFLAVAGDIEHPALLKTFEQASNPKLPSIFTLPIPLKGMTMPDLMRSDHTPFWLQGIGAVIVTDTANFRNPHYHQPSDTSNTIDRKFLLGSAQIVTNATTALLN